ncbi:MAG: hypothetical protein ABII90_01690 [Bacteroidota bacterium]
MGKTVFLSSIFILISAFNVFAQTDTVTSDTTDTVSIVKGFKTEDIRDNRNLSPEAARVIEKGDKYFIRGPLKYEKTLEQYLAAHTMNPDNAFLNFKVGQCYLNIKKDRTKAVTYLEKAYRQNKRVDEKINYYLGQAYHLNFSLESAIEEYEKYIELYKKTHRTLTPEELDSCLKEVNKRIEECKTGIELVQNPVRVFIHNLGDMVNSPFPDYDPFISSNDTIMIFTSRRDITRGGGKAEIDAEYYEDIFVSYIKNGKWTKAQSMNRRLNMKTNNAIIGLSHDGKKNVFIQGCGRRCYLLM